VAPEEDRHLLVVADQVTIDDHPVAEGGMGYLVSLDEQRLAAGDWRGWFQRFTHPGGLGVFAGRPDLAEHRRRLGPG
jgi:hypothetical protein